MKYFKTDGIRGIPNKTLGLDFISKLSKALAGLNCKSVAIATDTRESKDLICSTMCSAFLSVGIDVIYLGVTSTPNLIYYSFSHKIIAVMITASHNPYSDNGIKVINKGFKLNEKEELLIESLIESNNFLSDRIGIFIDKQSAQIEYLRFLERYIQKTDMRIVLDYSNGATYKIGPRIFSKIGKNIINIANKPNGKNINENVGSLHIDYLKSFVLKNKCDIGFAFDGDGDRIICVSKNGKILDGDSIIYILAVYLKKKGILNNNGVVLSVMANLGIIKALEKEEINYSIVPVGDKNIFEEMSKRGYVLGGEPSGHIIYNDIFHTGDGLLIAILMIRVIEELKLSVDDLIKNIDYYPCELRNIPFDKDFIADKKLEIYIENIKQRFNDDCKIVVRKSGTEKKLRVMVMSKSKTSNEKIMREVLALIGDNL